MNTIKPFAINVCQAFMLPVRMTHVLIALMDSLVMCMVPQMTLIVQVCISIITEETNDTLLL